MKTTETIQPIKSINLYFTVERAEGPKKTKKEWVNIYKVVRDSLISLGTYDATTLSPVNAVRRFIKIHGAEELENEMNLKIIKL